MRSAPGSTARAISPTKNPTITDQMKCSMDSSPG
jgi:hypothetical protein